ncbi:MAG TPA: hypothetical protein VMG10_34190 [Gemmataceae bacterium]|nr:hypothetical protein [Gemmataceae bacterium]
MMKLLAQMVGYVATAMAFCAVLFSFGGMWCDVERSALRLARGMMFEMRRSQALQDRLGVSNHLSEAKSRIIANLVDGRLHLREAIDQFQSLNTDWNEAFARDEAVPEMVATYIVPTDPESVGRQVFGWARAEVVAWPPDKAKRLLADLESEFRELFGVAPLPGSSTNTELTREAVGWSGEPPYEPQ